MRSPYELWLVVALRDLLLVEFAQLVLDAADHVGIGVVRGDLCEVNDQAYD
jgi:hypothetical protein